MDHIPFTLQAVAGDRELLTQCLDALDSDRPAVERADLALAIALLAARYENVLSDSVYPQIADGGSDQSEADGVAVRLQRAREAIGVIRADMRGVAAINAHASDPEGVDEDIDDLAVSLRELLEYEATNLFPLVERLSHGDAERLREAIESASRHQTSLPDPPENGALRRVAEVKEAIGLSLNDHSTPWHPGIEAVLDRSA